MSSIASRRNPSKRAARTSRSLGDATANSAPDDDIMSERFDSVWDAIEDDPIEAERMNILSGLMIRLEQQIRAHGWTQKEAAKKLGVTQPRVSNLFRGKVDVFSIDSLIAMIARAGLRVDVTIRRKAPPRIVRRSDLAKASR